MSFVIDPDATKKYFEESSKQRRIYKKFKKKVEKLPIKTWKNKDDLALKVITTLHAKISEGKRNG